METRVRRLLHPAAHSMVRPLRTSHLVSGITLENAEAPEHEVLAVSNFLMLEQHGDRQRLFGGLQTHRIRGEGEKMKIRAKRVDLTNCDTSHEVIETFI